MHVTDVSTPVDDLREVVLAGATALAAPAGAGGGSGFGRPDAIVLERPPQAAFGDYATNAALLLAPSLGISPREVADRLGAELGQRLGARLRRFEVAGPGFLNLFMADSWLRAALARVLHAGEAFGAGGAHSTERILVEFVSANPTGPMHVGHARNAAYGDALARVLAFHGHEVEREFYVNDAGSQVRALGESIRALARGEEVPEDGYRGDYVKRLVADLAGACTMDPTELGRAAVGVMIGQIQSALQAFAVKGFDHWQFESALHTGNPSPVAHTLVLLEQHGHTYREDGALWLRTTAYGDDKDRVLVRSSGEHTYFASDIAYHQDKRERGFERQIDVWGADHHGYLPRMRAAYAALGGDPEHLEMLTMQLVHLVRRGERAQMSKRAGEFVTLEDLVSEVGVDAARWFLLSRSHDTTIDLDLDLARAQSRENPVYYVQYAHARIVSVLALAGPERVAAALEDAMRVIADAEPGASEDADASEGAEAREVPAEAAAAGEAAAGGAAAGAVAVGETIAGESLATLHPAERALIKRLLAFPGEMSETAKRRAPHRIATYALELAQDYTAFYEACRIVGADGAATSSGEPPAGGANVESLRLALSVAAQRTIARCLDLLGVSAPQKM